MVATASSRRITNTSRLEVPSAPSMQRMLFEHPLHLSHTYLVSVIMTSDRPWRLHTNMLLMSLHAEEAVLTSSKKVVYVNT